jgi:hypothetical protein
MKTWESCSRGLVGENDCPMDCFCKVLFADAFDGDSDGT